MYCTYKTHFFNALSFHGKQKLRNGNLTPFIDVHGEENEFTNKHRQLRPTLMITNKIKPRSSLLRSNNETIRSDNSVPLILSDRIRSEANRIKNRRLRNLTLHRTFRFLQDLVFLQYITLSLRKILHDN